MKAERKEEEKWVPIVITLESKEEAQYLWHVLNIHTSDIRQLASTSLPFPEVNKRKMWNTLDQFREYFK